MMKETNNKHSKSKNNFSFTWLRRTEYMGTDLSEMTHKFKSEVEIQTALREGTENALAEVINISLEERAEASFRDINHPKTLVHPFKKGLKPAKVWNVFPDHILAANKYAVLVRIYEYVFYWNLVVKDVFVVLLVICTVV